MKVTKLIQEDLIKAMREKDALTKGTLQIIKAELTAKLKEKQLKLGSEAQLIEEEEFAVIQSAVKKTEEALINAGKVGSEKHIEKETFVLALLLDYLPEQLDKQGIEDIMKALPITVESNMGDVMTVMKQEVGARASGQLIASTVKEYLSKLKNQS